MHCTEHRGCAGIGGLVMALALVAGCSSNRSSPAPVVGSQPVVVQPSTTPSRPSAAPAAGATAQSPTRPATPGAAVRARNWDEWRRTAALQLVAANRTITYDGEVPEPLLAIPILEIELNADGSVRRIAVARQPTQARDTVQLAIDAVHRAAPFGEVSHLPKPWKYTEVFLFNDARRFKPRTLDL